MTLTIRQRLEAIRDDHTLRDPGMNECLCGDYYDTCRSRMHAVAALKALEEAEFCCRADCGRFLVPDPAPPTENT